jgi:hypothetical protein
MREKGLGERADGDCGGLWHSSLDQALCGKIARTGKQCPTTEKKSQTPEVDRPLFGWGYLPTILMAALSCRYDNKDRGYDRTVVVIIAVSPLCVSPPVSL